MAWLRIAVALLASLVGGALALVFLALNGYREDVGTPIFHTLWLAIPLAIASAVVALLGGGAIVSRERRERWSGWAIGVVFATIAALVVVAVVNRG